MGVWHHVAATYDGSTWSLYLDGNLDAQLAVNRPAADASTVAAALAGALNGLNVPEGHLDGAIDEVRIWSHARTRIEHDAGFADARVAGPTRVPGRHGGDRDSRDHCGSAITDWPHGVAPVPVEGLAATGGSNPIRSRPRWPALQPGAGIHDSRSAAVMTRSLEQAYRRRNSRQQRHFGRWGRDDEAIRHATRQPVGVNNHGLCRTSPCSCLSSGSPPS
jgi:hypothetical protein